ncbi:PREDICTED: double-strand-break repair protein rad21 homolog isoform X2 [Priapulus caudatus]|uniref:Double-strand-break repair protein rad21 homolog isoform X2 n=1 Tax=Priapulus caudatus TaxID=37621 RepID=A0ABM1EL26_PRICU|nr:PREDICTED: double-strand-break repair protein rad21 homolog isoform X2 [Priapulus caudatus]
MFYAHYVLSKKGPLARVWLAAHWDKKLTKAHVFETNLEQSVDNIIQPKVKMALRTSGHLLLGVVRIYSRKAKYLLADCNEAFVKIKMAFRPGAVDLPEENREANIAAITLPEVFHDFDSTMADLTDIDVQPQFNLNQSRAEEITIREDYGNITLVGDDGFGDMGFDDREMLRESSHLDQTLLNTADASNLLLEEQPPPKKDVTDASLDKQMEMDFDKPLQDDGFGGAVGEGLLGDANFMEEGGGLFDDAPMEEDQGGAGDAASSDGGDVGGGFESDAESYGAPAAADDGNSTDGEALHPAPVLEEPPEEELAAAEEHGDQTTLIQNEEEAFTLEPLDSTNNLGNERVRVKRKRKLIIDEIKGIDGDDMRAQLSDTSDIITTLDLAPPTKKLMHWKETGGVEKLFALPGRALHARVLSRLFTNNLVTRPVVEDEFDQIPAEDRLELDEPEVHREVEETRKEESLVVQEPESRLEVEPPVATEMTKEESALLAAHPDMVPIVQPDMVPIVQPDMVPIVQPDMVPIVQPDENQENQPPLDYDPYTPGPVTPFTPGPIEELPEERELEEKVLSPAQQQGEDAGEVVQMEGEAEEQFEERRWNKRSQQMLYTLQRALKSQDAVSFVEMTRKNTRKQAASRFYMVLVLKKQGAIEVEQTDNYDDITLTKGTNFHKVLA